MLQGTYVNYVQIPENVVYYELGKNAYETNRNEVEAAKQRIKTELKKTSGVIWDGIRWGRHFTSGVRLFTGKAFLRYIGFLHLYFIMSY